MEKNYEILPALAVRGVSPLPSNDMRIEVGRANSLDAIQISEKSFDQYVILLVQADYSKNTINSSDLLKTGSLAKILTKTRLQNGNYRIKFHLIDRVKIVNYAQEDPYFMIQYEVIPTILGNSDEQLALMNAVKDMIKARPQNYVDNPDEIIRLITYTQNVDELVDKIVFNLRSNDINKIKYLEEQSLNARLNYLIADLKFIDEIQGIENKINENVQKSVDESQKEYFLREKLKAIHEELGDKARKEDDIEKMRQQIEAAGMPQHIYEKAQEELKRYQETPMQSADSQIIKNYLDFLIALPWHQVTPDNDDLNDVSDKLDKNHYGLEKVKDRIIEYLAVKIMTKKNPSTILCLVGPPGVGKTSLAISIAKCLGRKFVKQSFGGVHDESEIRGHRRTYIGALPGRILKSMKDAGTINPVFLIDEIDKMSNDFRGDPTSAMLEVLDPEQNKAFSDHYVEEPYDLSQVLFIATANYLENIPAPLRDRMEIVELSSYTKFEKFQIAKNYLVSIQLSEHGIDGSNFEITDEAINYIIEHFTMEAGVRELNRVIGSLVRKTVKEILVKGVDKVIITKDNINEYLGKDKFVGSQIHENDQVGVVTGLAYTEYGGDTLDIEATHYQGHGNLLLTGKLGDVMKESAQAALSYVKSHAKDYDIDVESLEKQDIHIHVPEGAIPKDGPSAGVTFTTAIVSSLTNRKVRRNIGMTGEITLRGDVLPIGGLKEKSIAASRMGLKEILIPHENMKDIEDIPEEVRNSLVIKPVHNVSEVLQEAII